MYGERKKRLGREMVRRGLMDKEWKGREGKGREGKGRERKECKGR